MVKLWSKFYSFTAVVVLHVFVITLLVFFTKQSEAKICMPVPLSISVVVPIQEPKKAIKESKIVPKIEKQRIAPVISTKANSLSKTIETPIPEKHIEENIVKNTDVKNEIIKPKATEEKLETAAVVLPSYNADYLQNPQPKYPIVSRKIGEEGKVVLRVFVEKDGSAKIVEIKISCGYARLDESAMNAVREWKFVPGKKGDEAIATWVNVPIIFKLGV